MPNWTEQQKMVITSGERRLICSAAAGSGKTAVMVERVIRMIREGAVCRRVKTVFPALTYPAHATLITGCDPDQTLIGQNQPFQPDTPPGARRCSSRPRRSAATTPP